MERATTVAQCKTMQMKMMGTIASAAKVTEVAMVTVTVPVTVMVVVMSVTILIVGLTMALAMEVVTVKLITPVVDTEMHMSVMIVVTTAMEKQAVVEVVTVADTVAATGDLDQCNVQSI